MRRVHPNFDLSNEGADDRPSRILIVVFRRRVDVSCRTILSFQLKGQNVDRGREMFQRQARIVIAQLGEV